MKLVFSSGKKFHCDAYVAMEARSRGIEELDTLAIMTNELNAFQVRQFFWFFFISAHTEQDRLLGAPLPARFSSALSNIVSKCS